MVTLFEGALCWTQQSCWGKEAPDIAGGIFSGNGGLKLGRCGRHHPVLPLLLLIVANWWMRSLDTLKLGHRDEGGAFSSLLVFHSHVVSAEPTMRWADLFKQKDLKEDDGVVLEEGPRERSSVRI